MPLRPVQRGHRAGEPIGDQLSVEHRAVPEDRQPISEPSKAGLEDIAAEPVAAFAAPVPRLDRAVWLIDDEAADAINLRLAHEPLGFADGKPQRP